MSTKLKCLLLDDELPGLTYLKMLCEQITDIEVVKAFNDPVLLLNEQSFLDYDFCIMDIEMPSMNGLQVANLLNGKPVIFTTAYKEYAVEAFDLNAIDYVQKPIKKERLQQAIDKAKQRISTKDEKNYIQLNTDKGKTLLFFDTIAYIKTAATDSRDKIAILMNGVELVLKNISFEKLLELLPSQEFIRINKRELIALKIVHVFSFDEITSNLNSKDGNPIRFQLSEVYRPEFMIRINS